MTDNRTKRMTEFVDVVGQVAMSRDPSRAIKGRFGHDAWQPVRNWIMDERERIGQPGNDPEKRKQHAEILYVLISGMGAIAAATISEAITPQYRAENAENAIKLFAEVCRQSLNPDKAAKDRLMAELAEERGKP